MTIFFPGARLSRGPLDRHFAARCHCRPTRDSG